MTPVVCTAVAAALSLLAIGCRFDTAGEGAYKAEVSVRILEPTATGVNCAARARQIAWIFHRCLLCEFGVNSQAVLAEDGVRDASGGNCIYSARPELTHFSLFGQSWNVVATDEEGWAAQCSPEFIEELFNTQGTLQGVSVIADIVFEHGTPGCIVEPIDG